MRYFQNRIARNGRNGQNRQNHPFSPCPRICYDFCPLFGQNRPKSPKPAKIPEIDPFCPFLTPFDRFLAIFGPPSQNTISRKIGLLERPTFFSYFPKPPKLKKNVIPASMFLTVRQNPKNPEKRGSV